MEGDLERLTNEGIEESVEERIEESVLVEELIEETVEDSIAKSVEEFIGESTEFPPEESIAEIIQQPVKKYNKLVIGLYIFFCLLLGIYFGMTIYFTSHFYFGTKINSIDVSGKTVENVKTIMNAELQNYVLTLKERGGKTEQIKAKEVGVRYHSEEGFMKLKDSQNPFKWLAIPFSKEDFNMTVGIVYDEELLKERIDRLSCFDRNRIIEPQNASFQYVDHAYVIVEEVSGTKVDKDILYSHVADSILKKETEIDLEMIKCYIEPRYNSKSPKIIEVKDLLDQYISSKIIYNFGENREVLDGSIINQWFTVDENFRVILEKEKVGEYVDALSKKYNTLGKTIDFVTSSGETVHISGGDYGWLMNNEEETLNLIKEIKEGKVIIKEPVYRQAGGSYGKNGIGNTYVEIDLRRQYLWFYKDGSLIIEGDVVTGNVQSNHTTPPGIYRLKYKAKNVVLRGPGYAAPVSYWMPFNGGIGIHDATWRGSFGGNIYKTNGSHGCINASYHVAETIYNYIEAGIPIVCY